MVIATNELPLPNDADLRIIATTTTIPLDIQLRNYSKYWVEMVLEESELCNHILHTIIHEGFEPNNNICRILDSLYEIDHHLTRPHFELQIDGLYYTITSGNNNPLPHRCPNQIDRLVDYIKSIYNQTRIEPIVDFSFENDYNRILIQFICSCIWFDGRSWIIEWCRTELQRRLIENDEIENGDVLEITDEE